MSLEQSLVSLLLNNNHLLAMRKQKTDYVPESLPRFVGFLVLSYVCGMFFGL